MRELRNTPVVRALSAHLARGLVAVILSAVGSIAATLAVEHWLDPPKAPGTETSACRPDTTAASPWFERPTGPTHRVSTPL